MLQAAVDPARGCRGGGPLDIRTTLGEGTPILETGVGYREVPARNARRKGLLFGEYAGLLPKSATPYDVKSGRAKADGARPQRRPSHRVRRPWRGS